MAKCKNAVDGSVQDRNNSSALAMELLQSCTQPSIWTIVAYGSSLITMMPQ